MATAPQVIDCPEGEWTKVATNVVDAMLHVHPAYGNRGYWFTYRPTGGVAPDAADRTEEAIPAFDGMAPHPIASRAGEGIDGYIWCDGGDGKVILYN